MLRFPVASSGVTTETRDEKQLAQAQLISSAGEQGPVQRGKEVVVVVVVVTPFGLVYRMSPPGIERALAPAKYF